MRNTMKVYVAGKITGNPNYQEDFAAGSLAALDKLHLTYGHQLPITMMIPSREPEGLSREHYMRIAFDRVCEADVVAFLPNYQDSDGALLEEGFANYIGKATMYLTEEEVEAVRRETQA